MKSLINRIALAFVIASLMGISALAKSRKESVAFDTNIKVNGTVVSKGVYDLRFDDKTGELSVLDSGGKVVARATTRIEKRQGKARRFELRSTGSGDDKQLLSITFGGTDQNIVIGNSTATR